MLLTVNCGSSSLKFAVFDQTSEGESRVLAGVIEGLGRSDATVSITTAAGERRDQRVAIADHGAAVQWLTGYLESVGLADRLAAAAHRVVHGGPNLIQPVRITPSVRQTLNDLVPFAPDHLPDEIEAIDSISRWAPELTQVAAFDTAFHASRPPVARLYGLPRALADQGIIRYGFHGLSYEYIVGELRDRGLLGHRTIVAHLGNGASLAAILDGISIDTSMGFTPSSGLVMSSRSGDLDPGVELYLLRGLGRSADDIAEIVNERGGLLGISETSGDMRDLLARSATDSRAAEAVDVFCYQVRKYIGAFAAALGGLDTLVFTGGIGEHSAVIRARVSDGLGHLGVRIDAAANSNNGPLLSPPTSESRVAVWLLATNEELMLARHARALISGSKDSLSRKVRNQKTHTRQSLG
jgi:acetate kinase